MLIPSQHDVLPSPHFPYSLCFPYSDRPAPAAAAAAGSHIPPCSHTSQPLPARHAAPSNPCSPASPHFPYPVAPLTPPLRAHCHRGRLPSCAPLPPPQPPAAPPPAHKDPTPYGLAVGGEWQLSISKFTCCVLDCTSTLAVGRVPTSRLLCTVCYVCLSKYRTQMGTLMKATMICSGSPNRV